VRYSLLSNWVQSDDAYLECVESKSLRERASANIPRALTLMAEWV
jgi:hypothetical protein